MSFAAFQRLTAAQLNDMLDRLNGNKGRAKRVTSSSTTTSSVGVLGLYAKPVTGGRLYVVRTSALHLDSSVANDTITGFITHTTDGSVPTTGSSTLLTGNQDQADAVQPLPVTMIGSYVPPSDLTLSLLLCVSRPAGTGNVSIFGSSAYPIEVFLDEIGDDPGDTGVDI